MTEVNQPPLWATSPTTGSDRLVDLCSTACLPAFRLALPRSALTSCLYWKQRSSWRRAAGRVKVEEENGWGEEEVEEENYFCVAPAAVRRWRRCTDLHEVITRSDDRGTISELRQQPPCLRGPFNCRARLFVNILFLGLGGLSSNRRVPGEELRSEVKSRASVFDSW